MKKLDRRHFIRLSAAAATVASIPSSLFSKPPASEPASGSPKKGLGLGPKNPSWPGILSELRCRWCYTWMSSSPQDIPDGIGFVPMVRSRQATAEKISRMAGEARAQGIKDVLGLNEPDASSQDDMTVEQALEIWPLLMETGMRIGSPGCIHPDNEWMTAFMEGVKERNLRVDFVCVHSYGGPNAKALIKRLERIHEMYERPLWMTEFGVGDWSAQTVEENRYTADTVLDFMNEVLPMLDDLECLERYAWFPAATDRVPLWTSALFDSEGNLTPLGERYSDA